jgi:hypothetical protein
MDNQGTDGCILILSHQAAISLNISTENCSEFTSKTFICHNGTSLFKVSNSENRYAN